MAENGFQKDVMLRRFQPKIMAYRNAFMCATYQLGPGMRSRSRSRSRSHRSRHILFGAGAGSGAARNGLLGAGAGAVKKWGGSGSEKGYNCGKKKTAVK